MTTTNAAAVSALIALGRKADKAEEAAALVVADGDGALGEFLSTVATTIASLKKGAREEVLSTLKEEGIRSVPGVSVNVATTYALIGDFLVEHPEEPAVLSGKEFEASYNKIKSALYSSSRVKLTIQKARNIIAKAQTLEEAAQNCLDAAPADSSFVKKVREAVKALTAVNEAVEIGAVDPKAADLIEELIAQADVFVESVSIDDVVEIREAAADEAAAAA